MVQTVSKILVKDNEVENFIDIFKQMIEPTKKEKGYIEYEMYQDSNKSNILVVLEKWETKEDFDNHLKSEHFNQLAPLMEKLMLQETDFTLCKKIVF